jgi:hypothetical protein
MFSEHSPKRLNLNPECRMNFYCVGSKYCIKYIIDVHDEFIMQIV